MNPTGTVKRTFCVAGSTAESRSLPLSVVRKRPFIGPGGGGSVSKSVPWKTGFSPLPQEQSRSATRLARNQPDGARIAPEHKPIDPRGARQTGRLRVDAVLPRG